MKIALIITMTLTLLANACNKEESTKETKPPQTQTTEEIKVTPKKAPLPVKPVVENTITEAIEDSVKQTIEDIEKEEEETDNFTESEAHTALTQTGWMISGDVNETEGLVNGNFNPDGTLILSHTNRPDNKDLEFTGTWKLNEQKQTLVVNLLSMADRNDISKTNPINVNVVFDILSITPEKMLAQNKDFGKVTFTKK